MIEAHDQRSEIEALLARAPGKRPQFLKECALDHMIAMIMELACQLWVTRERLYSLEAVLSECGAIGDGAVENWKPSPDQEIELGRMRDAMLRELFRTILARDPCAGMPEHTNDPQPPS